MDLIHIDGKPYVLVPMHEYRRLTGVATEEQTSLPGSVLDQIAASGDHPVKIIRKHRGLTQIELAQAAGLSRPYLAEIESNRKSGSITAMKLLAKALDVPAGLLISSPFRKD